MGCEQDHLAEEGADAVAPGILREVLLQPFLGDVRSDALWIEPRASEVERMLARVAREDLDGGSEVKAFRVLAQQHGHGIGFLSGGAARDPHAHPVVPAPLPLPEKVGDHRLLQ